MTKTQAITEGRKVADEIADCCWSCHEDHDLGYAPYDECWPACCCNVLKALKNKFPSTNFIEIE